MKWRNQLIPASMIIIVVLILFVSDESFGRIEDQNLIIGRAVTMSTSYDIGDVAISDSSICHFVIRENRKELYLNPLKEGHVTMTIWDTSDKRQDSFTINVVAVSLDTLRKTAENFASSIPGVRVEVLGESIILMGEVNSPLHLSEIENFVKNQKQVVNQVQLSGRAMDVIAERIEKAINTPGIKVRSVRNRLLLEGITYSNDLYKKIDTIAKLYAPEIVNLIEIRNADRNPGYQQTVQLDVYFVEIKNSALRHFGIQWAPGSTVADREEGGGGGGSTGGGGGLGLAEGLQTTLGFVLNLFPKIQWVHESGRGRVLEKPSFVVKSGESVNFYSGTEVPYYTNNQIEFKNIGAEINAQPISHEGSVDLKLGIKISSLSATVDGGIDRNEVATSVYVESGKSVVLAGLLRNNDVRTYNKVPDDLDVSTALFPLFLSRDFQSNKSQFYVFITPTVLEQPSSAEMRLKRWLEINKEIELSRGTK